MVKHIVILTGAGISADSGIPTFRDANGLWNNHRVEDVASPVAYRQTPELVHEFYDMRRAAVLQAKPNAAHYALVRLERRLRDAGAGQVTIITQNVDDLHERAGSTNVIHMHGKLNSALCTSCGTRHEWKEDLGHHPPCPACGKQELRPDIVWFGENVYSMNEITEAVEKSDLFVVIGTSGNVWPAAGLAETAASHGARTILLNLEETGGKFHEWRIGPAVEVVPTWADHYLRFEAQALPRWEGNSDRGVRLETLYIDIMALATGEFPMKYSHRAQLPGIRRWAESMLSSMHRNAFNVVLVASGHLMQSSSFMDWYSVNFGSGEGFLPDQLLFNYSSNRLVVTDILVTPDKVFDAPQDGGTAIHLGGEEFPDWMHVESFLEARLQQRAPTALASNAQPTALSDVTARDRQEAGPEVVGAVSEEQKITASGASTGAWNFKGLLSPEDEKLAWIAATKIVAHRPWLRISWYADGPGTGHFAVHDGAFGAVLHFDDPHELTFGGVHNKEVQIAATDLESFDDSDIDWKEHWGPALDQPSLEGPAGVYDAIRWTLTGNVSGEDDLGLRGSEWRVRPANLVSKEWPSAYELEEVFPSAGESINGYAEMIVSEGQNAKHSEGATYWHEPLWVVFRNGRPWVLFDECGELHMPSNLEQLRTDRFQLLADADIAVLLGQLAACEDQARPAQGFKLEWLKDQVLMLPGFGPIDVNDAIRFGISALPALGHE